MPIKYCSITGADDAVDVNDLNALAREFPFVEWAILLMQSRAGQARFPTTGWIENFAQKNECTNAAMHLCDDALLGFVAGKREVFELMDGFNRIQLNLKFGDVKDKIDMAELIARVKESPRWQFILQYAKGSEDLLPKFKDVPNHAVLFDESAGCGELPESWQAPIAGHFCGYAGGLNPDNVGQNLEIISKVIPANYVTWIDMETGVRTNDVFDLAKVRRVLEVAAPYVIGVGAAPALQANK